MFDGVDVILGETVRRCPMREDRTSDYPSSKRTWKLLQLVDQQTFVLFVPRESHSVECVGVIAEQCCAAYKLLRNVPTQFTFELS